MKKSAQGFSAVETCIVIAVLVIVAGGGYVMYRRNHTTPANPAGGTLSNSSVTHAQPGTTGNITDITSEDAQSEVNLNTTYSKDEQQTVQSTDNAAADIGGAYNDSSL